jgi:hypothetical protein
LNALIKGFVQIADDRRTAQPAATRAARRPVGGSRRGATRADQFVALVNDQPGVTVGEAAEQLKTSRNALYKVTGRLQREGRLRKEGRGFYPVKQHPRPAPQAGRDRPSAGA